MFFVLFCFSGDSRYLYAHEILDDENSLFKGQQKKRDRRISIICRNEPSDTATATD